MTEHARPFRRRLLLNTASSGAANAWAMVVTFIALPVYLSGLGTAGFGTWVLLQTFSATNGWLSLADLGVVVATVREVPQRLATGNSRTVRQVVTASLQICLALGVLSAIALLAIGPWLLPRLFNTPADLVRPLRLALVAFSVQIVFDMVINSVEGSLEGLQRVDLSRAADMCRRTLVVAASAATALVTGDLAATALASMLGTAASAVVATALLRKQLTRFWVRPERADRRQLMAYGRAVALLRPLGVLQRTMDRVIVGAVLGPGAVSFVEIANQLQAGSDAVLSASSYAVVPASSWLQARDDRGSIGELAERGTRYSMIATIPVVVATAALAGPLVALWLGGDYAPASGLATVAVLAIALKAPLAVGSQMLVGMGHATTNLRAAAVSLFVNLGASIWLVHVVGIVGVFQGTILGMLVLLPLLGVPFLRHAGIGLGEFWRKAIGPVVLPAVAQVAVLIAVLAAPLGDAATLTIGLLFGTGAFLVVASRSALPRHERAELRALLRRAPAPGDHPA